MNCDGAMGRFVYGAIVKMWSQPSTIGKPFEIQTFQNC